MHVIELCNRTVKGTVDMSCLCEWTECIMCTCCFLHFAKLTVAVFFFMKMYNQCLISFSKFVIVLINW